MLPNFLWISDISSNISQRVLTDVHVTDFTEKEKNWSRFWNHINCMVNYWNSEMVKYSETDEKTRQTKWKKYFKFFEQINACAEKCSFWTVQHPNIPTVSHQAIKLECKLYANELNSFRMGIYLCVKSYCEAKPEFKISSISSK